MAAAVFSQHSSNPLEVGSSDQRNREYKRRVQCEVQNGASEDPANPFSEPNIDKYHRSMAPMFPLYQTLQNKVSTRADGLIDLDEDEDEDEDEDMENGHTVVGENDREGTDAEILQDYGVPEVPDYHSDDEFEGELFTDEENTLMLRPTEEREEIEREIHDLEASVPQLDDGYRIVDRLGTGTFSSVYKAVDLRYQQCDNRPWLGQSSHTSSASFSAIASEPKAFVAIKRIYVTSNPERIRNEIHILEDCRSCRHVSQIITAFRKDDQVVVIMPYHRNVDFRDYYRQLSMDGIKAYFRCMFRALRDIHARGIIHRDVKPANFLFDPQIGAGILCDFGLACRITKPQVLGSCLHGPPTRDNPHGRLLKIDANVIDEIKRTQREARVRAGWPSEKVGYPENDVRPQSKANRAGTRGFRAPEVLFKCGAQSGALDMWSAGVILLFFLTRKFPLFQSNDDNEALLEIACIIGKRKIEKAATLHSRTFISNLPTLGEGMSWSEFVEKQNPDIYTPLPVIPHFWPHNQPHVSRRANTHPPTSSSPTSSSIIGRSQGSPSVAEPLLPDPALEAHKANVKTALDLVSRLLEPESTKRITPRQALRHAFLREDDAPDDDDLAPHLFGKGVCGKLHFIDEELERPCVKISVVRDGRTVWRVRPISAGEGVAFGKNPCEFHAGMVQTDS